LGRFCSGRWWQVVVIRRWSLAQVWLYFKAYFEEIWAKLAISYEILTLKLVILTNFWRKFGLFSLMRIRSFLKLLMAKFSLFNLFGPGIPVARTGCISIFKNQRVLKWMFTTTCLFEFVHIFLYLTEYAFLLVIVLKVTYSLFGTSNRGLILKSIKVPNILVKKMCCYKLNEKVVWATVQRIRSKCKQ